MMLCCLFSQDKVYAEKYIDPKTAPAHIAVRVGLSVPVPLQVLCCHDDLTQLTWKALCTKEYDLYIYI